jgi:hypothetical protein
MTLPLRLDFRSVGRPLICTRDACRDAAVSDWPPQTTIRRGVRTFLDHMRGDGRIQPEEPSFAVFVQLLTASANLTIELVVDVLRELNVLSAPYRRL